MEGLAHSTAAQFIGRFHPLLVHLPIALILLVFVLEIAGLFKRWAHLRAATGFVLGLAAVGAVAAAFDGWLLAKSGGYRGAVVTHHMWGGIALAALCLVLVGVRTNFASVVPARPALAAVYWPLLIGAVGLLVWTSHNGGTLTHGPGYLTQYMPARFRGWLGVAAPKAKPVETAAAAGKTPATLYAARIAPIFERSCVSCHGPDKSKGDLRMDTYDQLMHGGEDGPVIAPWLPQKSEMVRRITLPPDDDDFMPNDGKSPLSAAEVKMIEQWIAAGASDKEPAEAVLH